MTEIPEHLRQRAAKARRSRAIPDHLLESRVESPTSTFRTTVPIPEVWGSYLQTIREVAGIERVLDDRIEITIDAADEYELAEIVLGLRNELQSVTNDFIDIPRPTKVEP